MLKLIRNLVAIAPIYESDKFATQSGVTIIKPDQAKSRTTQGIVKYLGPKVRELQAGDYVFYTAYDGLLWSLPGYDGPLIILPEHFIVAAKRTDIESTIIPGLYFKARDGETIPANYEQVVQLISEAFEPVKIKHDEEIWDKTGKVVKQGYSRRGEWFKENEEEEE